jgi:flagellar hook-associated protein 1 FlgK
MQQLGSINQILNIGKSALSASRARLTVAGYNIANANTPGYHREVVSLTPHSVLGGGVSVGNPIAIRNNLLARNLVQTFGRMGYHDGAKGTLVQIQETFNELDGIGLMTSLDSFQAALKEMAANPSGSAERQTVLGTSEGLLSQFHSLSNQLESAILATEEQAEYIGEQVSLKAAQVFTLNADIKALASTGMNPEAMIDERDRLVGQIGEMVDVTVVHQGDGSVDLFIAGGRPLVTDAHTSTVSTEKDAGPRRGIGLHERHARTLLACRRRDRLRHGQRGERGPRGRCSPGRHDRKQLLRGRRDVDRSRGRHRAPCRCGRTTGPNRRIQNSRG